MSDSSIIHHCEEWPIDLSKFADLNRKVVVIYRNGEREKVEITSSPVHSDKIVVTFDAIVRANRIYKQNFALSKLLRQGNTFVSNLYEKNGGLLHQPGNNRTENDYDIVAISLRLDGTGQFFATPVAQASP